MNPDHEQAIRDFKDATAHLAREAEELNEDAHSQSPPDLRCVEIDIDSVKKAIAEVEAKFQIVKAWGK